MTALLVLIDAIGLLAALLLAALLLNHVRLALRASAIALEPPPAPARPPADAPPVLVQIPLYNEPDCVAGAIRAAAALDWPRERLEIQLLDDSTDGTSAVARSVLAELGASAPRIRHLRRTHRQGFKAGALAAGLAVSRAPYVAILDADFRPPRRWLVDAVAALERDPRAAFVQSRFEFINRDESWMTRTQQMLVDTHFLVEQAGRMEAGEPIQFNGTAGVWRREAIVAAGGWSGDTLAEDLDLALRASLAGWTARLLLAPAHRCEAPAAMADWRRQQRRWSTGFMQVAGGLFGPLLHAPRPARLKAAILSILALQLALPAALIAFLAFTADAVLRGPSWGHGALALLGALVVLSALVGLTCGPYRRLRRGGVIRYASTLAGLPFLLIAMVAANSGAVLAGAGSKGALFVRTPKSGHG
jgi:cellulose synthase/poly-beta-1,6-N-acetylglucosamine synthase-like glycosyltransferase